MIINQLIKITNLMKKVTFTSLCLMLMCTFMLTELNAQTTVNMPYNNGPVTFTLAPPTTCFFNFFDNGGAAGNYTFNSGAGSVVTFCPSSSATHRVQATFNTFSTEASFDALFVFNGPTISSPQISSPSGVLAGLPNPFGTPAGSGGWQGTQAPDNTPAEPGNTVRATAANPSGCLTFAFDSDGSVELAGWSAVVSQVPINPCTAVSAGPITVSTGANTCTADAVTAFPTFTPGGCQASLTFQYAIGTGPFVTVPQPFPATLVIPGLTSGTHTITYRLIDPCGGAVISVTTQQITVADLVDPVLTCPATINVILDPGACSQFVGYTVTATDNCPLTAPSGTVATITSGGNGNSSGGMVFFNINNLTGQNITVTELGMNISNGTLVNVYRKAGTHVGFETNPGAWGAPVGVANATVGPF